MSKRDAFLSEVEGHLGAPVLMGAKGPDAFDCSGMVTYSAKRIGGPDWTEIENAQALHDHTRLLGMGPSEGCLPGDLAFYGLDEKRISHVGVIDEYGGVISADGATHAITSLKVAMANPANRVRRHTLIRFRTDMPYVAVHRFLLLDQLDLVSR
jgi:cell wall-associated NlpC family hydrolase